jgi:thiamine-phosphate pyrophosphorylase
VITDEAQGGPHGHVRLGALAAHAGADVVQFREKRDWSTARLVATARQLVEAAGSAARVVIDDRADVALASGAAGVHLGLADLAPSVARWILGPEAWIGATAHDEAAAERLSREAVDYLGVGPVFPSTSKADPREPLGLAGLARIVRRSRLPVIAIGGLDPARAAEALDAGAWGVAVLWDVAGRDDPGARVAELRRAIDGRLLHAPPRR